ncbi:hypothetical protein K505DRAFT_334442 [Melanomma pulvis-pyrius CBS 109.77]|uniref:Uncharacterized protein n=1 Tax=Melanomma pulvis-pyrius CBS 109.77 TaxID=1314802 RepID=A0A6A6XMU9_9PLEO|nr:hypothetical protein K505DRAFT_334442 [Melanomma pulvis-pyrius CBS 109.77]
MFLLPSALCLPPPAGCSPNWPRPPLAAAAHRPRAVRVRVVWGANETTSAAWRWRFWVKPEQPALRPRLRPHYDRRGSSPPAHCHCQSSYTPAKHARATTRLAADRPFASHPPSLRRRSRCPGADAAGTPPAPRVHAGPPGLWNCDWAWPGRRRTRQKDSGRAPGAMDRTIAVLAIHGASRKFGAQIWAPAGTGAIARARPATSSGAALPRRLVLHFAATRGRSRILRLSTQHVACPSPDVCSAVCPTTTSAR